MKYTELCNALETAGMYVFDIDDALKLFPADRKVVKQQIFPINREILRLSGIEEEPKEAIIGIIDGISDEQLEQLSEEVAPFLFDEAESRLIREAKIVVRNLLTRFE
jgi:hypothetical protein